MRLGRLVVAVAIVLTIGFLIGSASPAQAAAPYRERVWGNGAEWEALMIATPLHARTQHFYLIAPIDATSPQSRGHWGFGPHDNVMNVPPRRGISVGQCQVVLIVPGPNGIPGANIEVVPDPVFGIPFVRAADVNGDGKLELLTSAAVIGTAVAQELVLPFEPMPGGAPIQFMCPVRPLHA